MLKTFAAIGLAATLALPATAAFAYSGNTSSYGTYGVGPRVPTQSLTPYQRSWNAANQSKVEARRSAEWMRRHHRGFPLP